MEQSLVYVSIKAINPDSTCLWGVGWGWEGRVEMSQGWSLLAGCQTFFTGTGCSLSSSLTGSQPEHPFAFDDPPVTLVILWTYLAGVAPMEERTQTERVTATEQENENKIVTSMGDFLYYFILILLVVVVLVVLLFGTSGIFVPWLQIQGKI